MNLNNFFDAKNIAIIGVSRDPKKVGHVIFRNFIDSGFEGNVYVVNPKATSILNKKSYPSISSIKHEIDLAIIAVPADFVTKTVEECGKKGIRDVVIVSSGFREEGNMALDRKLENALRKYKIRCIGPNCLGCYDAYTKMDSLFLPRYRMKRPEKGGISFVCQSGAVGSATVDLATEEGYGFSKFISYGNAMNVDESDIIEYLGKDPSTNVICLYIEGAKDGRKFLDTCKRVVKKKPIIVIKGGKTSEGSKATMSHTGALAGSYEIYKGAFRQAGVIEVNSLGELFDAAKILDNNIRAHGNRILVITNGGGYGILSTDSVINHGLQMARLSNKSLSKMQSMLPKIKTKNPIDLLGDANIEGYRIALDIAMEDKNVDIILLIVLYQTPLISTDIVNIIIEAKDLNKKPIVCVSTGGEFTEVLRKNLEENKVPVYTYPTDAVDAIARLVDYHGRGK